MGESWEQCPRAEKPVTFTGVDRNRRGMLAGYSHISQGPFDKKHRTLAYESLYPGFTT